MKMLCRKYVVSVTLAFLLGACGERIAVGTLDAIPGDGMDEGVSPSEDGSTVADGSRDVPFFRDAEAPPTFGCAGKSCGALCVPCAADAATCDAAATFHTCAIDATCRPGQPTSCPPINIMDNSDDAGIRVACAAKGCGAPCRCEGVDPTCTGSGGVCGSDGLCSPVPTHCP